MIVVQVVRLDGVYLSGASLDNLWDHAADAVVKRHYSLAADGFPRTATVVLDLPSAFFSLMWVHKTFPAKNHLSLPDVVMD